MRIAAGLILGLIALAASTGRAAAGDPVVHVEVDEKNNAAQIHASIHFDAPPSAVWGVISDCTRAPQIIPNLESCRALERDPAGRWQIEEHIINWNAILPKLRTVVRSSYEPGRRLTFKRVEGDMRISEGEWRMEPIANGQATRLSY